MGSRETLGQRAAGRGRKGRWKLSGKGQKQIWVNTCSNPHGPTLWLGRVTSLRPTSPPLPTPDRLRRYYADVRLKTSLVSKSACRLALGEGRRTGLWPASAADNHCIYRPIA